MNEVQSIRSVGSKRGYGYHAWGVYRPVQRRDGVWTYRLMRSGRWFRSDRRGRLAFPGIPIVSGIRHGSHAPVPAADGK